MPLASLFRPLLFRRRRFEREAFLLYGAAVAAARDPLWYAELGVPDTLDGRFDMVSLFVFLLVDRARSEPVADGPVLAQAVFDAMFADMDQNLREMGVGDLSVGKKVKVMWEAFNGRARVYAAAVDSPEEGALAEALGRNVWRAEVPPAAAARLAGAISRQREDLATQDFAALVTGRVRLVPAGELLA